MTNFEKHKQEILDYVEKHKNNFGIIPFLSKFNIPRRGDTSFYTQDILLWGFEDTEETPEQSKVAKAKVEFTLEDIVKLIVLALREEGIKNES